MKNSRALNWLYRILLGGSLTLLLLGYAQINSKAQTCTTYCYNGPIDSRLTWPPSQQIRVNISSSFTSEQRTEIEQAFRNWQNNPNTGAGVTYFFTYDSFIGFTPNAIQVNREAPPASSANTQPVANNAAQLNSEETRI